MLPAVVPYQLIYALSDAIDWHRLYSDFVNRILSKLGSFAHDWHVGFLGFTTVVIVSQHGLDVDDIDHCDFVRMQNIVQRLLKLKASGPIFILNC